MTNVADDRPANPTPCPSCGEAHARAATYAGIFVYLRCSDCAHVWAIEDRRQDPSRRPKTTF
jgi:ribosomal protein S27E